MTVPLLLSPISGRITDRHGAKWPAVSGLMLIVPSLILLRIVDNDNGSPFMQLAALMAAIGLALAIAIPPLITEVSSAVEQIELANPGIFGPSGAYGQAYGLLGSAFAGGALVGPLYAGFVRDWLGWKEHIHLAEEVAKRQSHLKVGEMEACELMCCSQPETWQHKEGTICRFFNPLTLASHVEFM